LASCRKPQPFPEDVVARYDGGEVRLADVQKELAAESKPSDTKDPEPLPAQRARVARRIVAEETWFARMTPERLAAEKPLQRQLAALKRGLLLGYLQTAGLEISSLVSERDAHARYDSIAKTLHLPASYTLRHVYIRVDEGSPAEAWSAARAEAEKVRAQMLAPGVDLDALVASSSDSEDAVSGGWIRRLRLGIPNVSQAFEQAVRKLKPGEVSPPVQTLRGYQVLLLVNQNEPRTLGFDEMRDQIVTQIVDERRQKRVAEVLAEQRAGDPLTFDLAAVSAGEPQGVVVKGPKTAVTLEELKAVEPQLASVVAEGAAKGEGAVRAAIDAILQNQALHAYALSHGMDQRPEFVTQWETRRREAIIDFVRNGLTRERMTATPAEDLKRFYEDNKARFSSPRRLHLVGGFLTHRGPDLYATFTRAEKFKKALEQGTDLKAAVAAHADVKGPNDDGDFGWTTHDDMAARGRIFYDTIVGAKPGTWLGPVKWERGYAVVRIEGVQEPAVRPYEEVAPNVRRAYARQHLGPVRESLEAETFAERHGQLNPALAVAPAGAPAR
jgi:parvulin-like peptidyl-prolyl isomerase